MVIAGAGISGLTAGLRLAERGYKVTIYEEKDELGGNLGAHAENGAHYDVYSHMFSNFYENFWRLAEDDLKLTRCEGGDFEPRTNVKILDKGAFPRFLELVNVGSFESAWTNVLSGVAPPADMLLWAYSMIDGLSYATAEDDALDKVSVEAFVRTRPYATPLIAALHDVILLTIWSVHGYETSSAAYRRFIAHSFPNPAPLTWQLTGDLGTKLITPLVRKIESLGGTIVTRTRVVDADTGPAGPDGVVPITVLKTVRTKFDAHAGRFRADASTERVVPLDPGKGDAVILAVPPMALFYILTRGRVGSRIIDRLPGLSEVRRLAAEPIPVLNLYFKRKLPDIPKECVLLRGSASNLTFLDLSQLWHDDPNMKRNGKERTVLCLAASDYYGLPSANPQEEARAMIAELHEYVDTFVPGARWGDEASDIDWGKTHFSTNVQWMLFANTPGGKEWQPETEYPDKVANLFFAGDNAVNPIRMATVESAVTSGLQAARAVWRRQKLGAPVEIAEIQEYSPPVIAAMKAMMAPWAYAAKFWSSASQVAPAIARGDMEGAQQAVAETLWDAWVTPASMAADVWQSLARLYLR